MKPLRQCICVCYNHWQRTHFYKNIWRIVRLSQDICLCSQSELCLTCWASMWFWVWISYRSMGKESIAEPMKPYFAFYMPNSSNSTGLMFEPFRHSSSHFRQERVSEMVLKGICPMLRPSLRDPVDHVVDAETEEFDDDPIAAYLGHNNWWRCRPQNVVFRLLLLLILYINMLYLMNRLM